MSEIILQLSDFVLFLLSLCGTSFVLGALAVWEFVIDRYLPTPKFPTLKYIIENLED
jgi:hypothetical protein